MVDDSLDHNCPKLAGELKFTLRIGHLGLPAEIFGGSGGGRTPPFTFVALKCTNFTPPDLGAGGELGDGIYIIIDCILVAKKAFLGFG